ncbi:N-acetylmuramoyl-L-alanine amidase [Caldicellulosiruptoraceae bacterium PP1]
MKAWKIVYLFFMILFIIYMSLFNDKKILNAVSLSPIENKVIVIDPGHGGIDPGAVANGIRESDINLQISKKLKDYFEAFGFDVLLTRYTDQGLYNGNVKNKKNQDLLNRKKIIINNNPIIFLSIHLNSFPIARYYGAQVFYEKNNNYGKQLAEIVQEELRFINKNKVNNRQAKEINIFILKNIKVPAILVECGFMSNHEELNLLCKEDYQNQLAYSIFKGCLKYLESVKKGEFKTNE